MAKKSVIARERKRERMVEKFAEKRRQLKEEGNYDELDKLPKNSSPIRFAQPLPIDWSSAWLHASFWSLPFAIPRHGIAG